jgi:hypothetical protein
MPRHTNDRIRHAYEGPERTGYELPKMHRPSNVGPWIIIAISAVALMGLIMWAWNQ